LKVKKLLELQALIEDRKIPADMIENDFNYWSRSKGNWVNILDMDLIHVVRALNLESTLEVERHKDKNLQKIKDYIAELEVHDG
tara:strand:- start:243 stop:494 length:252 start_codon:yes stop_codon:yes gene_type:complete